MKTYDVRLKPEQLKHVHKLHCSFSILEDFTAGRDYLITCVMEHGCYLMGDNGFERYINKFNSSYYSFSPIY